MKKLSIIFSTSLLVAGLCSQAQQQSGFQRLQALKSINSGSLSWYTAAIKPQVSSANNTGTVLGSRTVGGSRVDIGVGLPDANTPFAANGAQRQTNSGDVTCTTQPMKLDYLVSGNFSLFSSEARIYPGQFYNINSVITNAFSAFNGPQRKPYQIGINIFNAQNNSNMLQVTDLTRSPQPEIQTTLLAPNYGAYIPAEGIMTSLQISSSMELKASMEGSRGVFLPLEEMGIPADISAGIEGSASGSTSNRLNYYMVSFYQPMYTLNLLTNNDQLFQQTGAHAGCTNGAYVESVTYGRRIFIIVGSAATKSRVDAALNAALGVSVTGGEAAGVKLGASQSGETSASLRATATQFFAKIYGGNSANANAVFSDIVNFKNNLGNYFTSPSASRFGAATGELPLHYTLRRISDGSLLTVRSTGSYDDLIGCNTATYKVEVLWKGIKVDNVVEAPGDNKEDIWGSFSVPSASVNGSNRSINKTIKNISKNNAISIAEGRTDADDITVNVLEGLTRTQVTNTTLNFTESMFDWEPLHNPEYKPANSAELKFNLSDKAAQINNLQPGGQATFDNIISLKEEGPIGTSRIGLIAKIRVTRI